MTFLPGQDEICFLDSSMTLRIYSLLSRQFRPSTLSLPFKVAKLSSSPDGLCMLAVEKREHGSVLYAKHWNSFGQNDNLWQFELGDGDTTVTSIAKRSNTYVIQLVPDAMTLQSSRIKVVSASSEFQFKSKQEKAAESNAGAGHNNALLDIWDELWTK
jgi:hypothetical protein